MVFRKLSKNTRCASVKNRVSWNKIIKKNILPIYAVTFRFLKKCYFFIEIFR